jgi:hypothetical protein
MCTARTPSSTAARASVTKASHSSARRGRVRATSLPEHAMLTRRVVDGFDAGSRSSLGSSAGASSTAPSPVSTAAARS